MNAQKIDMRSKKGGKKNFENIYKKNITLSNLNSLCQQQKSKIESTRNSNIGG